MFTRSIAFAAAFFAFVQCASAQAVIYKVTQNDVFVGKTTLVYTDGVGSYTGTIFGSTVSKQFHTARGFTVIVVHSETPQKKIKYAMAYKTAEGPLFHNDFMQIGKVRTLTFMEGSSVEGSYSIRYVGPVAAGHRYDEEVVMVDQGVVTHQQCRIVVEECDRIFSAFCRVNGVMEYSLIRIGGL